MVLLHTLFSIMVVCIPLFVCKSKLALLNKYFLKVSLTDDIDKCFGATVSMLIVSNTGVLAGLITAQAVIKSETWTISNNLMVVLPVIVCLRVSRCQTFKITSS